MSRGLQCGDESLPGSGLVQNLLQHLLARELIEQFLIFESGLKESCPLSLGERACGVPP
jgi:hypothetical protein